MFQYLPDTWIPYHFSRWNKRFHDQLRLKQKIFVRARSIPLLIIRYLKTLLNEVLLSISIQGLLKHHFLISREQLHNSGSLLKLQNWLGSGLKNEE